MITAFIPARAGSKRIKNKNMSELGGRPLLSYTLDLALHCDLIDRIVVSTDSSSIAAYVYNHYKSTVIHERPSRLAEDKSIIEDSIRHYLLNIDEIDEDIIILLQPTSPLRSLGTLNQFCISSKSSLTSDNCLISVHKSFDDIWYPKNMQNSNLPKGKGFLISRLLQNQPRRQQDREPIYIENSSYYSFHTKLLKKATYISDAEVIGYLIDPLEGFDINTGLDLQIANIILENNLENIS